MKLKLIMLPEPILVSDEKTQIGNWCIEYQKGDKHGEIHFIDNEYVLAPDIQNKIIGGIPELPSIDLSALSEEDFEKIGWVDIKKLSNDWSIKEGLVGEIDLSTNSSLNKGFIAGFNASQSINDKKFSLKDIQKAIKFGELSSKENIVQLFTRKGSTMTDITKEFVESLHKPKVFDIEINMMLQTRHGVEWYDLPNQTEGREPDGIYRRIPRIENNSIKITKIN